MKVQFYLLAILCVQGCALHQPMSELSMFKTLPGAPDSTFRGSVGITATGTTSYERESDFTRGYENPNKLGGGVYFMRIGKTTAPAISLSLGVGLVGADMSFPLSKRYYLTLSGSYLGGGQIILQKKMYETNHLGISLGINYKAVNHWMDDSPSNYSPVNTEWVHVVGIKSLLLYKSRYSPTNLGTGSAWVNLFVGYAPGFQTPVAGFAAGFGAFNRRH